MCKPIPVQVDGVWLTWWFRYKLHFASSNRSSEKSPISVEKVMKFEWILRFCKGMLSGWDLFATLGRLSGEAVVVCLLILFKTMSCTCMVSWLSQPVNTLNWLSDCYMYRYNVMRLSMGNIDRQPSDKPDNQTAVNHTTTLSIVTFSLVMMMDSIRY